MAPTTADSVSAHPPVHDVDDRRAVTFDRGHRDFAGIGVGVELAQRRGRVYPLAVLLEPVENVGLADEAGVDQLLGVLDRGRVPEREAQLGPQPGGGGQFGGLPGLAVIGVHWLLAQHVLARRQGVAGDLEVRLVARHHVHDVDVRVVQQFAVIRQRPLDPEPARRSAQRRRVDIGERDDFRSRVALPAWNVRHLRPATRADYRDLDPICSHDLPCLLSSQPPGRRRCAAAHRQATAAGCL